MTLNETELALLRKAVADYPRGMKSPNQDDEYKAMHRLIDAGAMEAERQHHYYGRAGPVFVNVRITEYGREALAQAEGDETGGVERTVYVKVVLALADNPKAQLPPDELERVKKAIPEAPMSKLREAVAWLGTFTSLAQLGAFLIKLFG